MIDGLNLRAFGGAHRLPVLLQTEASECGLVCVAMVAGHHGHAVDLQRLRQRFAISRKGTTLESLLHLARELKLDSRPVKVAVEHLHELRLPCVLHWDMNHFVVLASVTRRGCEIHDPALGKRTFSWAEFGKHFTGIALELEPAHDFVAAKPAPKVGVFAMMGTLRGLRTACTRILLLALALEAIAVASPFFVQWVVDQVVVTADRDLLTVLGLGFLLLIGLQAGIGALRAWLVVTLSTQLSYQWLGNVFRHLLKLPLDYFEKRHVGHIVSCFGSVTHIQKTLTTGFVQALVDGVLVLGTLAMMLLYSASLTAVTLAAVALYAALRWAVFRSLREATAEQIQHEARQQTHFLESAAGVQSVRLFARAESRRVGWMNLLARQFNAELRIGRVHVGQEAAQQFLFGAERVLIVWLAALAVLDHRFSLGMLFAFLAYKEQFAQRVGALIDKVYDLRMLRLHADRVADIVLHEPELAQPRTAMPASLENLRCDIEVRDLGFRYADGEPPVIDGLNLRIEAGECVAITGASGCGKTTLVKLMLGLLTPTAGEVLVGGVPIGKLGLDRYRSLIGTVMQDDRLFTGSIADNIAFFDSEPDVDFIEQCARAAAIHDEIEKMPMGYHTLVGDVGIGLSGGQKQRVLLARALYRRPRILVLDEATSHLDLANEHVINEVVMASRMTRLIVAHRPDTIARADRVVSIEGGRLATSFAPRALQGDDPRALARIAQPA